LVVAAAILAGGAYLVIGGGGGGGATGGTPSSEPGAAASRGPSPDSAAAGYRCPTSLAALKQSTPGNGIPGCEIRFWATLPAGWHQGPVRLSAFPPGAIISQLASEVRYANVPLTAGGPIWPIRMPPNGIAILIEPFAPASRAESARVGAVDLQPSDFHRVPVQHDQPLARTNLYTGGWRFQVQVRVGANGPQMESLDQANAVLNSIETTQHLCPCGVRSRDG
jgi:hypothetical protein